MELELGEYGYGVWKFKIKPIGKFYYYEVSISIHDHHGINFGMSYETSRFFHDVKNALFGSENLIISEIVAPFRSIRQDDDDLDDFFENAHYYSSKIYKNYRDRVTLITLARESELNINYDQNIDLSNSTLSFYEKLFLLYGRLHTVKPSFERRIIGDSDFFFKLVNYYDSKNCDFKIHFDKDISNLGIRDRDKKYYELFQSDFLMSNLKKILFPEECLVIKNLDTSDNNKISVFISLIDESSEINNGV